jgi:Yersinia/Haemophilus virulence surface antigen
MGSQSDTHLVAARSDSTKFRNKKTTAAAGPAPAAAPTKLYVGGMCHSMALYWIVAHQKGIGAAKSSFIDWIYPGGRTDENSKPNLGAVAALVTRTAAYKENENVGISTSTDEQFLLRYGIKPARRGVRIDGWDDIGEKIGKERNAIFLISYHRPSSGHACAAITGVSQDIDYFDPNYGEASLPDRARWPDWWDDYKTLSGYGAKYTTQDAVEYF